MWKRAAKGKKLSAGNLRSLREKAGGRQWTHLIARTSCVGRFGNVSARLLKRLGGKVGLVGGDGLNVFVGGLENQRRQNEVGE